MGKLRFTLTYIIFWLILGLSCLLAENFAIFTDSPMNGFSVDGLITFSIFVIGLLVLYYVLEHKKNGVTFDKVLLPILIIYGAICIATVWWQGPRIFVNLDDNFTSSVSFTSDEKISYTLQIIIWFAVLYGMLFAFNRYSIAKKWAVLCPFLYVAIVLVMTVADVIMEFDSIVAIFKSTYTGPGLQFIIYNENVWAHIVLVALLSCIVLNIKKFRIYYYVLMFYFFGIILFTSCATATFVGAGVIVLYTFFEILTNIKGGHLKRQLILLAVYLVSLGALVGGFALMIHYEVPAIVNFWSFISNQILKKDYTTLTSRTGIWATLLKLLKSNPIDLTFGLGYKTGNAIFTQYYLSSYNHDFAPRSAHNGFLELLLRHGLVGISLYITMLVLFAIGVVQLIIKKHYRVAFFYGICVLGLLAHSMAESTMFFTPNVGGMYMTLVFFMPVLNARKEKYFDELLDDLNQLEIRDLNVSKKDVLYYINVILIGLTISAALVFTIRSLYYYPALLFINIFVICASVVGIWLVPLIAYLISKKEMSFKDCIVQFVYYPIKNNIIAIIASVVLGFIVGFVLQRSFELEAFIVLLFFFAVLVVYYVLFVALNKPENCNATGMFDHLLTKRLKYKDSEAIYDE